MTEHVCEIKQDCPDVPWESDDFSGTVERREEVVRCRDCAHASSACAEYGPDALYCIVMDGIMSPDGFCSFGERRDAR